MISLTSPVKTRAHHWPAGGKLVALCAASVGLFVLQSPLYHVAVLLGTIGLYASAGGLFFKVGMKRLWVLWPFVLIVGIWNVVIGELSSGTVIVMRMVTSVALANLVTMTTSLTDMIAVVRRLLKPLSRFGVNTAAVEMSIGMVIRIVPTLIVKGQSLYTSWKARSVRRANWRLVLPLTLMALDDAEQMAQALKARGGLSAQNRR